MKHFTSFIVSRRNFFISRFLVVLVVFVGLSVRMTNAINITTGSTVSETFTIGTSGTATMPTGWKVDAQSLARTLGAYSTAVSATTQTAGASMSGTASSGIYNYANSTTTTDRAVGGLSASSSNRSINIYTDLVNSGATSITSLTISYKVEKYRTGTNAAGFFIQLYYSNDGSIWTSAGTDFLTSFAADATTAGYGATPGATVSVSSKTLNTTIAASSHLYLAWHYSVISGTSGSNAQALGIDDVSITANGTVVSSISDIIANTAFTYPTNITYGSFQGTNPLTTGNSVEVGQFDIRDGGGSTDGDALATTLTGLTFNVANSSILRRIAIFDGTTNVGEVAGGSTATFTGLNLSAADGGSKTFSVRASFLSSVTDNQQFSFTIASATASGSGSGFAAAAAGGAATSTTGDNNRIEVSATDIIFDQNTSTVSLGAVMSPSPTIRAIDGNVNYDLDYSEAYSLAVTTGDATFDGTATISGNFSAGVATLSNLKFNASGNANVITATSGLFTDATNAFDVTNPQPEINVKQASTSIATGGSYGFGNQLSGTSSSAVTFTVENLGTADLNLSGAPKVAISGTNAAEFSVDVTSTTGTVSSSGTTTFTVTFAPSSQGAKTAQISIDNNDATGSENPYLINLTGTGTVSAESDITNTSGYSYTSNVAYASYQTATTLTTGNSVGVTGVTICDGGATTDADNLGTTLTALSFTTGGSTAIRTAALFDGSTNVSEVAVNGATTITFSGLTLNAADGGTKDIELRVTYMSSVTDNQQVTFTVSSATASSVGSDFASANAGGVASTATGDINRIEVTATQLAFVQQPSATVVSSAMSPSVTVKAVDANGITDLDFIANVDITSSGTLSSSQTSAASSGVATFAAITHSATGTGIKLTAASSGLTSVESNTFNVTVQAAGVLLFEENFNYSTILTNNGYTASSGTGTNNLTAGATGLIYNNYGSSSIGNALSVANTGQDDYYVFTQQNSPSTLYASFLVNISEAKTGDYVFAFAPVSSSTTFRARFFIKSSTNAGFVNFGIANISSGTVYGSTDFALNTTHLVVVKYQFTSGVSATATVYVNPDINSEPSIGEIALQDNTGANAPSDITSFTIRQGSSGSAPTFVMDGIRIATNWGALMGNSSYDANTNLAAGNYNTISVLGGSTVTQTGNATVAGNTSIASGATLQVNAGKQLTLTGNLSNNGSLVLKSDATGTATLLSSGSMTGSGTATVEQYLPQGRNWYVGIPVANAGETITASALTTAGASSVSYWNESTGAWVNNYSGALTPGKGYIAVSNAGSNTSNISFNGELNSGSFPVTVTRTVAAATKPGFNLIANPYPSYLNPCALISGKSATMESTIWYRTKGASYSFETVNTGSGLGTNGVTGYIPPMQAFWVRVKPNANPLLDNSETLTFTNDMRYHANPSGVTTTLLKAPYVNDNKIIRLTVSNGVNSDETIIYTLANASNEFDIYDSNKMSNDNDAIPEISSILGTQNLVINGFNSIELDQEIPLGFKTGQAGNFTIKANEISNLDANTAVILKDKDLTLEWELMSGNDYAFSSGVTNSNTRFALVFKAKGTTTGVVNPANKGRMLVYSIQGRITVQTNAANVKVFNALGQQVHAQTLTSDKTELNNSFVPGMYTVVAGGEVRKIVVNDF